MRVSLITGIGLPARGAQAGGFVGSHFWHDSAH
jgi:hypothetical protein